MNVQAPKNRFTNLFSKNQINKPNFLNFPPPKINIDVKESVGSSENNQVVFNPLNPIPSPIEKKKYSNQEQITPSLDFTDIAPFDSSTSDLSVTVYPDEQNQVLNTNTLQTTINTSNPPNRSACFSIAYPEDLDTVLSNISVQDVVYKHNDENYDSFGVLYPYESAESNDFVADNPSIPQNTTTRNNKKLESTTKKTVKQRPNRVKINSHLLQPLVEEWVAQIDTSLSVKKATRSKMNRFISFLSAKGVDIPTKIHLQEYINAVHNDPRIKASYRCYISTVHMFFDWAVETGKYDALFTAKETNTTRCNQAQTISIPPPQTVNWINTLTVALEVWLKTLHEDVEIIERYKSEILTLLDFLESTRDSKRPTASSIQAYYSTGSPKNIISIKTINLFFSWTEKSGIYKNIALNIFPSYISDKQLHILEQEINSYSPSTNVEITIDDMSNAGFFPNKAMDILDNELILFKIWIQSLNSDSVYVKRKGHILKFANFLYSCKITTPTQKDIIEFYNHYLVNQSISTINRFVSIIKAFFNWTKQTCMYPNIAINIRPRYKWLIGNKDVPILCANDEMKFILPASKPLIIFRQNI